MNNGTRHIPLYLSTPHPCSYLSSKVSRTLFADPKWALDMAGYSELLRYGFRRSGEMVYAPHCDHCSQCRSIRVLVDLFQPRRVHRRVLQANADLRMNERDVEFDPRHYDLYLRYTALRHQDGEMAKASPTTYMGFLSAHWSDTRFMEFLDGNRLLAVAVVDRVDDGLSAVYTFFDPTQSKRSLGTMAILRQIEYCRSAGLPYLYLGYWIQDSPKMRYKADFQPAEIWAEGAWHEWHLLNPHL